MDIDLCYCVFNRFINWLAGSLVSKLEVKFECSTQLIGLLELHRLVKLNFFELRV